MQQHLCQHPFHQHLYLLVPHLLKDAKSLLPLHGTGRLQGWATFPGKKNGPPFSGINKAVGEGGEASELAAQYAQLQRQPGKCSLA